jgi:hypothetical protein
MKVTVEGQVYDFDQDNVRNRTLIAIERATGMTTGEWQDALTRGSVLAATALVWVILRENGQPDLEFDDVDFNPQTMEIADADEEPGKDLTDEAPSPTT